MSRDEYETEKHKSVDQSIQMQHEQCLFGVLQLTRQGLSKAGYYYYRLYPINYVNERYNRLNYQGFTISCCSRVINILIRCNFYSN